MSSSQQSNNGARIARNKYPSRTHHMEIVIETLSGTAFEMTVLPSETIYSIKAKIQRVEGIPISHQHLIHNMRELQHDEATLADCGLKNGSRLRLVLSLQGGPISTQRLPLLSCSDVDSEPDFSFEPIPSGSHIVLLMQDGENLSLYKVIENEDGTFSPMLEPWSCKRSQATMEEVEIAEEFVSGFEASAIETRAKENAITHSKLQDIKKKMEQLSLQKKKKKSKDECEVKKITRINISDNSTLMATPSVTTAITSVHNNIIGPKQHWGPYHHHHLPPLPQLDTTSRRIPAIRTREVLPSIATSSRPTITQRHGGVGDKVIYEYDTSLSTPPRVELYHHHHRHHHHPTATSSSSSTIRQTHLSHFVLDNRPKTSPEKLYVVGHSFAREIQKETKEMCKILGEVRRRHYTQELLAANRSDTPNSPKITPNSSNNNSSNDNNTVIVASTSSTNTNTAEEGAAATSSTTTTTTTNDDNNTSTDKYISKKTRKWRCSLCRRKLNITNAHTCRCGKSFCASHRYAETHNCTYDYKADGKKLIAQNNPLVIATKLPKI